jgi:hypothetical protein
MGETTHSLWLTTAHAAAAVSCPAKIRLASPASFDSMELACGSLTSAPSARARSFHRSSRLAPKRPRAPEPILDRSPNIASATVATGEHRERRNNPHREHTSSHADRRAKFVPMGSEDRDRCSLYFQLVSNSVSARLP